MKKLLISGLLSCSLLIGASLVGHKAEAATPEQVTNIADDYIGVPYRWGGTTPSGFDCSGFIGYTFKQAGKTLPRTTSEMYNAGQPVAKSALQEGDLVFFSTYKAGPSHVGLYVGDNQFIHASTSYGVKIDSLSSSYWSNTYYGSKRVLQPVIGWSNEGGSWYFYNNDSVKQTGWLEDQGAWYFLDQNGVMQTGWLQWNNSWYYMNGSGAMQTGWINFGNIYYYLNADGTMAADTTVDGYYLNSAGAVLR